MLKRDYKILPEAIKRIATLLKNDDQYKDWDVGLMAQHAENLLDEYLSLRDKVRRYSYYRNTTKDPSSDEGVKRARIEMFESLDLY